MTRYEKLMDRIGKGERILIDGGTGTEVDRRGVPQLDNAWNGGGTLSHPHIVCEIHEDYLRHGAEIVISNTFATSRHALRDAGCEEHFVEYNRRAVELASQARSNMACPEALVAGGISYWTWTGRNPPLDDLENGVAAQAAVMAEAGADFLVLEMMIGIERMLVTLAGAQRSGLPVWVGLSCEADGEGGIRLLDGDALGDALTALGQKNVPLISIMHTDVRDVDACLDIVERCWSGAVGVYAHTGDEIGDKWVFDNMISPADYAAYCRGWLARGVQVIGGCCGIRPEHIAEVRYLI
ncbi:MAG: homocysteine S-methyltransferase family protein [Pseudomonadota bacterium]